MHSARVPPRSRCHLQQQIIPEPGLHQQPQPPNLIKSEAAEEAIVFMLDLMHVHAHARGLILTFSAMSESKNKSRCGCRGACGSVPVRPHQIITFINGQMDF